MSMVAAQADVLRPEGFRRVARWLAERSHRHEPRWLDVAARTCEDAATALEVQTGQIAKSVIFRHLIDGVAVLVVTSGDRRVDLELVEARLLAEVHRVVLDLERPLVFTGHAEGAASALVHEIS